MKKAILVLALGVLGFIGNYSAQTVENISATQFSEKINKLDNEQILDVRTPGEWAQGTIKDAIKINVMDKTFESKVKELDKDLPVLVYCKSGGRSSRAARQLSKLGFKEIYNLSGGITSWRANKLEVVK